MKDKELKIEETETSHTLGVSIQYTHKMCFCLLWNDKSKSKK